MLPLYNPRDSLKLKSLVPPKTLYRFFAVGVGVRVGSWGQNLLLRRIRTRVRQNRVE